MAKREARSENVGVRFRASELARLDRAAEKESLTRSEIIREGTASLLLTLRLSSLEDSKSEHKRQGTAPP